MLEMSYRSEAEIFVDSVISQRNKWNAKTYLCFSQSFVWATFDVTANTYSCLFITVVVCCHQFPVVVNIATVIYFLGCKMSLYICLWLLGWYRLSYNFTVTLWTSGRKRLSLSLGVTKLIKKTREAFLSSHFFPCCFHPTSFSSPSLFHVYIQAPLFCFQRSFVHHFLPQSYILLSQHFFSFFYFSFPRFYTFLPKNL